MGLRRMWRMSASCIHGGRRKGEGGGEEMKQHGHIEYCVQDMYHVNAHGVDENMINVHDDDDDD